MYAKIQLLGTEYAATRVRTGSPFLFFFFFWCTKVLSFLQQRSTFFNTIIHRIAPQLPQPEFIIENKTGIFLVRPFDDSTTICSDYFEAHLRPWLEKPDRKGVFLDIGANRGLYTVLARTTYGFQEVHAFEPNPAVCTILEKNIALNNIQDHVTVHPIGLGEEEVMVGFAVDEMHLGGGRVAKHNGATLTVSVKPLDMVLDARTSTRISFIKIDTEGYEFDVLAGMSRILADMPNTSCIMVESEEPERVATILAPFGFIQKASVAHDHLFIKHAHDLHT